ncbi:unnamed protein product [Caenorhabditis auriculariae]|uniref:Uncharacterized protein n=1 Tax=Caenorhabditis auriculariae TaxID=2777116 RepID=A0A8S1GUR4_9PELO|nr:unnamed protein product [Caenorhabditis auriculariae]
MTARAEIEHRLQHYKKRSQSFMSTSDKCKDITDGSSTYYDAEATKNELKAKSRRQKSSSVCVATIQMENEKKRPPRTMNDFKFLNPEVLTMQNYEVQRIRLPALSTSEVFHEPPQMYVYTTMPLKGGAVFKREKKEKAVWGAWMRKNKHSVRAYTLGGLSVIIIVIFLILEATVLR